MSDGLLLHPHIIVSMLINDLADIDNEVFLFLDDYHSVTDPAIRGAVSFLRRLRIFGQRDKLKADRSKGA